MRRFIAYALTEATPDHSSISRTRRLLAVETHTAVFRWGLKILAEEGLAVAETLPAPGRSVGVTRSSSPSSMSSGSSGGDPEQIASAMGISNSPTRITHPSIVARLISTPASRFRIALWRYSGK